MRTPEIKKKYIAYRRAARRVETLMHKLSSLEMRDILDREDNRKELSKTRNTLTGLERSLRQAREAQAARPPRPVQLRLPLFNR